MSHQRLFVTILSCILFALLSMPLTSGQQFNISLTNANSCSHRIARCDSQQDYFPTKINFQYASSVRSLTYHGTYVTADIQFTSYAGLTKVQYVFVRCGCPSPQLGAQYKEFYVPASSFFVEETVAIPKLYGLGQRDRVNSVADSTFVTTPEMQSDVANGDILNIQNDYDQLSTLQGGIPDILFTGVGSNQYRRGWNQTMEARQFLDADVGETSPLGRAELIKWIGILTGAEDAANNYFTLVETRYQKIKQLTAAARKKPSVVLGQNYGMYYGRNGWSLTRGSSYMGYYLADVHAEYRNYQDQLNQLFPSGRTNISIMTNYFSSADYWVNAPGVSWSQLWSGNMSWTSQGDAYWLSQWNSVNCGRVFTYEVNTLGNPFFELAVVRPDLVLADLAYYLHADMRDQVVPANYQPRFYRPLVNATVNTQCAVMSFPRTPSVNQLFVSNTVLVQGVDRFWFFDKLHAEQGIKQQMANKLNVQVNTFEMYITNNQTQAVSASTSVPDSFYVGVNVQLNSCSVCSTSSNSLSCDQVVTVGRGLEQLDVLLQQVITSLISPTSTSSSSPSVVNVTSAVLSYSPLTVVTSQVVCTSGVSVPVRELPGYYPSSSSSGLSSDAKVAIGVSVAIGVVLIAIGSYVAFRAGSADAYKTIKSKQDNGQAISLTKV